MTKLIKIARIKPFFKGFLDGRPFLLNDAEPSSVSIPAFVYQSVPEQPFELEPKPQRRCLQSGFKIVALPLDPAISCSEGPCDQRIDGLCRQRGALHLWREVDVPDLDHAVDAVDPHQAEHPDGFSVLGIDHHKKANVRLEARLQHPSLERFVFRERTIGKIRPILSF